MVAETLRTVSNAERELENLSTNGKEDAWAQNFDELKATAEKVATTAISVAENWGKAALDKTKEITEDITQ